jgi:hypothetical protein
VTQTMTRWRNVKQLQGQQRTTQETKDRANRATHSRRRGVAVAVFRCRRYIYVPQLGYDCEVWRMISTLIRFSIGFALGYAIAYTVTSIIN